MRKLSVLAILLLATVTVYGGWGTKSGPVSLAGPWQFRLDPKSVGVAAEWFKTALPDSIELPGSTEQRGFGVKATKPTIGKLTRVISYEGPAWYQREITVPEVWRGKRVELFLERCHWETTTWVDGKKVGMQNSLCVPHVHDLGILTPGKHSLTVCVDNTYKIDIGRWVHAITEDTQGNWNGIIGRIELRATDPVWIRSVQVYPGKLLVNVGNRTGGPVVAAIQGNPFTIADGGAEVAVPFADKQVPWDEFVPTMREIKVKLEAGSFSDTKTVSYGLRQLGIKDKQFVVNGRPVMMRGAVDECVYPLTGYPPMDKAAWLRVLKICQSYGFNFMRFHSWCPPEAAFEAADELGFFYQVEVPLWVSGDQAFGKVPVRDQFIHDELVRILDTYGNHPSFAFMAMGNESGGSLDTLVMEGRARDTRHLYRCENGDTEAKGDFHEIGQRGVVGPRTDWDRWSAGKGWIAGNESANRSTGAQVPTFAHEVGQWAMYPDFKQIEKFTGTLRAHNYEAFRKSLDAHGMLDQAEAFFKASGEFSVLLYRDEIEGSMRTWPYGGFQILEARDYPGQGTALVGWLDAFWDSKGLITPEAFRRSCAATVCLLRMSKRVLTTADTFTAYAELAHYGVKDTEASPKWSIADVNGKELASGGLPSKKISTGRVSELGKIEIPLGKVAAPAKLVVTLKAAGTENSWNIWVYPAQQPEPPKTVHVAYAFDDAARKALGDGESVVLFSSPKEGVIVPRPAFYGPDSLRKFMPVQPGSNAIPGAFTPAFWNMRLFHQTGTLGLLCDPAHPALSEFPTENHSDWQWADLLGRFSAADSFRAAWAGESYSAEVDKRAGDVKDRSKAIILDETPADFRPIVQVIDNYERNSKLGTIFETRVGPGKLLVCAMDLETDAANRPAARQLKRSLLDYAAGAKFRPTHELPMELLVRMLTAVPSETVPAFVHPDTVSAASWSAKWIESSSTHLDDLMDATWIWTVEDGVDPAKNASPGVRYFRKVIDLDGNAPVTRATVTMRCDDHFVLFVNGVEAGKGDNWSTHSQTMNIAKFLKPGKNIIAVRCQNDGDRPNAAALIGKVNIERAGQKLFVCVTDPSWKWAKDGVAGWAGADFSDAAWKPAMALGPVNTAPCGSLNPTPIYAMENAWTCYRKSFQLSGNPKSASARIAVDSKYWLWVNGQLVVREGELKRGPTPNDTYFDEVDLASYLKKGANTVAILAWHFGKQGFSHKSSGSNGLLFDLSADGVKVSSDSSWRAKVHPSFGDTGEPHPNGRLSESNIRFDAGLDMVGWEQPGFADGSWPVAVELGTPNCAPWNRLVKRPVPFWKDYGLKTYVNSAELPAVSDGKVIKTKIPYNAQITPYFKVDAKAGQLIKIQMDNYHGGGVPNVRAEYVTRDGVQEFECYGWMNGHEVHYEMPAGIKILGLQYRETGFDTEFAGTFDCDDDFLIRLRTKAARTLYITMRDTYMDCPDRERALWWGDAVNELGESFYAFDRRSDLLTRKCIFDLVGWQKPDGVLFAPVPAGSWNKDLPLQMLASIGKPGFWTYGLYSGDLATINAVYPGVKRYMRIWDMKADGLVVPRRGAWEWGDWGDHIDMPILYNAWYHLALQGMRNMAVALKQDADLPWIDARLKSIEGAFNKTYWTGKEYRSPEYKNKTDDRANALAIVAGLAKPDQYPALIDVLKAEAHASPYMEKYVLEALCLMDQPTLAQERIKRRYAKMVDDPKLTTLWEGWGIGGEGFGGGTINHAWSGGPLTIMSQYFAGIAPTSPGFATYSVLPQMGSLKRISAKVVTVKGDIKLDLSKSDGTFTLALTSPVGTVANVGIPCADGPAITEVKANGKAVWRDGKAVSGNSAIQFQERTAKYLIFKVGPGHWEFTARQ